MRVQYFTACTLDGFIADENNSLDWLFEAPHHPDDHFWDDWFPTVGGLVWGATTYEGHIERSGLGAESWREYFGDRPNWIFSHHELPLVPDIDLRVVQGDVRAVHAEAERETPTATASGLSAAASSSGSSTTLAFSTSSSSSTRP